MFSNSWLKAWHLRNNNFFFYFSVHKDFESVIHECYAPYSPGAEDTEPFGLKNGTAWVIIFDI